MNKLISLVIILVVVVSGTYLSYSKDKIESALYEPSREEKIEILICLSYHSMLAYRLMLEGKGVDPDNPVVNEKLGVTKELISKYKQSVADFGDFIYRYIRDYRTEYYANERCMGFPISIVKKLIKY